MPTQTPEREQAQQEKVITADVIETKKIVIRDDQGRKRISMSCVGEDADICIYDLSGNTILIMGVIDYGQEIGQGQCFATPSCYFNVRNEQEDVVFGIETSVRDNQLLPALTMARGKGFPDYELCPHDAVKGVTPQKFAEYEKLLKQEAGFRKTASDPGRILSGGGN